MDKCASKGCRCAVDAQAYVVEGKRYCCETCAKHCKDGPCVCACCAGKC